MTKESTKTFDDLTADNTDPSGSDGVAVPGWAVLTELQARISSKTGTPTVPVTWKARRKADAAWVTIPTAVSANIEGSTDDSWHIAVSCAAYDMIAPYVNSSSGTFNLKTAATFTE